MSLHELLLKRRSIRKYQNKAVPNDIIMKLINESVYAPSSGNEQPWKFIIVNNKEFMNKMSDESKKNLLAKIEADPNYYACKYQPLLSNVNYNIFYNAPAMIFIVGDSRLKNTNVNCALAASYFMLAATDLGLGTCWINFAQYISQETRQKLKIPNDYEIVAPIIIGYPTEVPNPPHNRKTEVLNIIE